MVKNLPAKQEAWVLPLGWDEPLEEGMVTHSSILAWETPWTAEPGGLQSLGLQESDITGLLNNSRRFEVGLGICSFKTLPW